MKENIINEIVYDYSMNASESFSIIYNQNDTLVIEHVKYPEYLIKICLIGPNKQSEKQKDNQDVNYCLEKKHQNSSNKVMSTKK